MKLKILTAIAALPVLMTNSADAREAQPVAATAVVIDQCHKPIKTCRKIKRIHSGCNTWACVRRVKKARARRWRKNHPLLGPVTASWYGPGLYGNKTACGLTLQAWTAGVAHKTLACGTRLTICARRCVTTSVIDRGPYVGGRTFDLTAPVRDAIGGGSLVSVRYRIG